jgi:hypothetical protein
MQSFRSLKKSPKCPYCLAHYQYDEKFGMHKRFIISHWRNLERVGNEMAEIGDILYCRHLYV